MDNTKIALIGSAELPKGLLTAVTWGGIRQPKIYALTPGGDVAPGVHALAGSFLDARKIETAIRAASLVVYAPRTWRGWIPGGVLHGLLPTLLPAGLAGTLSLAVGAAVAV